MAGIFGNKSDIQMKMQFEVNRRFKETLHQIDLTKLLRAKIFNVHGDDEMSQQDIELVKDAIQPYLIGGFGQ